MSSISAMRAPWPVIVLVIGLLCPTELSIYLGGLRLPPYRIALLILLPLAVLRILSQRDVRLHSFDIMMIGYNVWTIATFMHHGTQLIGPNLTPSDGLVYGGSLAVDGMAGYLVARAWVRDVTQFRAVVAFLFVSVVITGLIALPELLLGQHFVHDILQSLTGYVHPRDTETRLGLTRAYGTFDHPIHLGTFCASVMALVWFNASTSATRWGQAATMLGSAFTALSSAPLLVFFVQLGLIGWDRVTRGTRKRATMTLAALALLYLAASLVMTRTPMAFIATGLTLDSWTGYYRLMIWESGLENVWTNPWAGLGLADWDRPAWMVSSTIDAFWLVIAMRCGIPAFLLLILSIGLLLRGVVRRGCKNKDRLIRNFALGWIIAVIALALAGCTVHYWNALYAYFFFVIGLAGWIADPKRVKSGVNKIPAKLTMQLSTAVAAPWPTAAAIPHTYARASGR